MEAAPSSALRNTFQTVWFGADVNLNGFAFKRNDIAFSYLSVAGGFNDRYDSPGATVGLDNGDGFNYATLPGTDDGVVTNDTRSDSNHRQPICSISP